jgi:peptidylprolyl isomerase/FKBP-type peptidyl-prolyl cis-trans isomerase FklB
VISALALLALLAACNSDDDAVDDTWRTLNEQSFNAVADNPAYTEIPSPGNNGSVYYRILTRGEGTKPIYFTSIAEVYLKGWFTVDYPDAGVTPGRLFIERTDASAPYLFYIQQYNADYTLREGLAVALQHMHEGDKWEVWVPCDLGYGQTDYNYNSGTFYMQGFSTLAYEIEVKKVYGIEE